MSDSSTEILLRLYEEQVRHGRHHETLRSQATNIVVVMSGAAIGFLASNVGPDDYRSVLGAFIIAINTYGFLMSLKHYERSRLHVTVAGKYRSAISNAVPVGGTTINEIRDSGKDEHEGRSWVSRWIRAYALWAGLHLVLGGLGAWFLF